MCYGFCAHTTTVSLAPLCLGSRYICNVAKSKLGVWEWKFHRILARVHMQAAQWERGAGGQLGTLRGESEIARATPSVREKTPSRGSSAYSDLSTRGSHTFACYLTDYIIATWRTCLKLKCWLQPLSNRCQDIICGTYVTHEFPNHSIPGAILIFRAVFAVFDWFYDVGIADNVCYLRRQISAVPLIPFVDYKGLPVRSIRLDYKIRFCLTGGKAKEIDFRTSVITDHRND